MYLPPANIIIRLTEQKGWMCHYILAPFCVVFGVFCSCSYYGSLSLFMHHPVALTHRVLMWHHHEFITYEYHHRLMEVRVWVSFSSSPVESTLIIPKHNVLERVIRWWIHNNWGLPVSHESTEFRIMLRGVETKFNLWAVIEHYLTSSWIQFRIIIFIWFCIQRRFVVWNYNKRTDKQKHIWSLKEQ